MKEREILDSWKEIAAYLGRSEKTCRRLEKELGLPVHRLEDTPKARVYAYRDEVDSWRQRTQHSEASALLSEESASKPKLKKLYVPVFALIGIVIVGVFNRDRLQKNSTSSISSDRPYLAILYFKNNTGDAKYDFWRSALCDSFITDLQQSKYIKVLSADQLLSVLRKLKLSEAESYAHEDLKAVAEESGVNCILQGSLAKAGETFRIDYSLQEISSGKILGSERMEGEGEESIFFIVDELTRKIKADLNLTQEQIAADLDKEIGVITTQSLEAYKYYCEGRKYLNDGEFEKSISLMQRAISVDPEFAMAYLSMANSYARMFYTAELFKYRRKAFELSDRLPDKEKYLIEGEFYRASEKTAEKAIEAFEKLIELYPDFWLAYRNLAYIYANHFEDWDKTIELLEIVVENDPTPIVMAGLSDAYMCEGRYRDAREALQKYIHDISDNAKIQYEIALTFALQRNFNRALEQLDKAFSLDPTNYKFTERRGYVLLFKGELKKAEEEFTKLLEPKQPMAEVDGLIGMMCLCDLQGRFTEFYELSDQTVNKSKDMGNWIYEFYLLSWQAQHCSRHGQSEKAWEAIEKMRDLSHKKDSLWMDRLLLFTEGVHYAYTGALEKAGQTADALREVIDQGLNTKEMRRFYLLMGLIDCKRGNHSKAIEYYDSAIELYPAELYEIDTPILSVFRKAESLFTVGNLDDAREGFEKILRMTFGRRNYGSFYAKAFYMLGKIYEQIGNEAKARAHFEKFLELWKDADPGIAEIEDAKVRLSEMKIS